jgi:hypothetical protein
MNVTELVRTHVLGCQSLLVDRLLTNGVFAYADVTKQTQCPISDGDEIYEWYFVSDFLFKQLKEHNEYILHNDYGRWWGRRTTGMALEDDYVMQTIAKES